MHNIAVLYKSAGDLDKYRYYSRIAILTKKGGPKYLNEMGLVYLDEKKHDLACEQFQEALQICPTYGPSHLNLSVSLASRGKYREALRSCQNALLYMPQDASVHRNLGKIFEALGQTADSLKHNTIALSLEPNDATLACKISLQNVARGNLREANVKYDTYRTLNGKKYDLKI